MRGSSGSAGGGAAHPARAADVSAHAATGRTDVAESACQTVIAGIGVEYRDAARRGIAHIVGADITVVTRRAGESEATRWTSSGDGS